MIYWQLNLLTNDKFAWFYCFRICVLCISDVSCACECECPNHSTAQRISFINIDSVWGSRLCLYQNQLSVSWFVYERDYCFQNISKKYWARDLPLKYAETNNKQPLVYTVIKFLYSWTSFGWTIIFAPSIYPRCTLDCVDCWVLSFVHCPFKRLRALHKMKKTKRIRVLKCVILNEKKIVVRPKLVWKCKVYFSPDWLVMQSSYRNANGGCSL